MATKVQPVIQHFPEMKKWLEDSPDRQLTKKLWGQEEDQPFKLKDLQIWIDNNGSLGDAQSKELKGKALKGKAKAQNNVTDSADASGGGKQKKKKKVAQLTR